MKDKDFANRLAEFTSKRELARIRILSNPEPYIIDLTKRCGELLHVLRQIEYALSPDMVCDVAFDMDIKPIDIQGEALIRCNRAKKLLEDYKHGR